MANQVLARKWRPKNFHEVVGQPHVVKALVNGLDNDRLHHAFLFTGTRGVGKTTLARILAKSLNCEKGVSSTPCGCCSICLEVDAGNFVDLIEVDAASRTKVEDTREILDNVQYAPTRGRYKVYLIDEVHMLSNSSFNALLKTLEEPPAHVKFLLATTDPQKLPVTVLSRCLRFHLKKISVNEISGQLEKLLLLENISFESSALKMIAKAGQGSMRDALSLTDQAIAFSGQNITISQVSEMLGTIDDQYVLKLLNALVSFSPKVILDYTQSIANLGIDPAHLLNALITGLHQLSLLKIDLDFVTFDNAQEQQEWMNLVDQISQQDIQLFYQVALHGRRDLPLNPEPELGLEMTLLRMVLMRPANIAPVQTRMLEPDRVVSASLAASQPIISEDGLSNKADQLATNILRNSSDLATQASNQADKIEKIPDARQVSVNDSELDHVSQGNDDILDDDVFLPIEPPPWIEDNNAVISNAELVSVQSNNLDNIVELDDLSDSDRLSGDLVSHEIESKVMPSIEKIEVLHQEEVWQQNEIENDIDVFRLEMVITEDNWLTIVDQLILDAIEKSVAEYLVFDRVIGETLYLTLEERYAPLLTKQVSHMIKEALNGYIGVEFNIEIKTLHSVDVDAHLAGHQALIEQEKKMRILDVFKQDKILSDFLMQLEGKLIPDSLIIH